MGDFDLEKEGTDDQQTIDTGDVDSSADDKNVDGADDNQDVDLEGDQTSDDNTDVVDTGDDDDGELESYESEEEYLKQFDLPGEPKSLDDTMASYKEAVKKVNELQRQMAADSNTQDKAPDMNTQAKPAEGVFGNDFASSYVDKAIKDGQIIGDENIKTYQNIAKVMDNSFNPLVDKLETVLSYMAGINTNMATEMREASWRRFKHKNLAERNELDPIMNKQGGLSYDAAFRILMSGDDALLSKFANAAQDKGRDKGSKKKLGRFSSPRRSKTSTASTGFNVKPFIGPGGELNESKLSGLGTKERKQVVDAYFKFFEKQT